MYTCHYCGQQCVEPIIEVKEITISNDGIEADVMVERIYCSEDCREEDKITA